LVIHRGEIWWAALPTPTGSGPGKRRPVLVVQGDRFNQSKIATVVCIILTSNIARGDAPGNVVLERGVTGLPKRSVANVSQFVTVDRSLLLRRVKRLPAREMARIEAGLLLILGLTGES
jgi:mRNA interferase MazF